jgi:hypothetical protein
MPQRIGFDRTIKLAWLDKYAWRCRTEPEAKKLREFMHEAIEEECHQKASRIKNITVLQRIWTHVEPDYLPLRQDALMLLETVDPMERVALHWGMALLAYPFFRDITTCCGRLLKLQPEFSWRQIRTQLYEKWGARPTLERAISRVIISMEEWGTLAPTDDTSYYRAAPALSIRSQEIIHWLLRIALTTDNTGSLRIDQFTHLPCMFPFQYSLNLTSLQQSSQFAISRQRDNEFIIELG